ncbi:MAG: OmpA family protein [Acidimicrobiales bacterium]
MRLPLLNQSADRPTVTRMSAAAGELFSSGALFMTQLFDHVRRHADDDASMERLNASCGLDSLDAARRCYEAAAGFVQSRLAVIGATSVETKSLVRTVRAVRSSERRDPTANFNAHDGPDDLVFQLFGVDAEQTIQSLAASAGITNASAGSVLEATSGVFLSSLGELAGDDLTVDSVGLLLAVAPQIAPHDVASSPAKPAESDVIPAAAAVSSPTAERHHDGPAERRSKAWLVAAPAVLLVGAVGIWFATSGSGDEDPSTLAFDGTTTSTVTEDPAETDIATSAEADPQPVSSLDTDDQDGEAAEATQASEAQEGSDDASQPEEAPAATSPPVPPGAPSNYAIMSQGRIFLRGFVASAEAEAEILRAVEEFVGPGVAVSEYVVDPEQVPDDSSEGTPVFIQDTVLFPTGSTEVSPDFIPLLGIGLRLLEVQPAVTMEVTGHTDSDGSDAANLALSQGRVDAVKAFFVSQGVSPDRVIAIGKGESEPVADNATAEGRQANRRVEFLIKGFSYGE